MYITKERLHRSTHRESTGRRVWNFLLTRGLISFANFTAPSTGAYSRRARTLRSNSARRSPVPGRDTRTPCAHSRRSLGLSSRQRVSCTGPAPS